MQYRGGSRGGVAGAATPTTTQLHPQFYLCCNTAVMELTADYRGVAKQSTVVLVTRMNAKSHTDAELLFCSIINNSLSVLILSS